MFLDKEFDNQISLINMGRKFWIDVKKRYRITNKDLVVVLKSKEFYYNYYTVAYLEQYRKLKKIRNIVILTDLKGVDKLVDLYPMTSVYFEICEQNDIDNLCGLYRLYKFSDQIIINSFMDTSDVDAGRLIGTHGISVKDIVAVSILGLPEVPRDEEYIDEVEKGNIKYIFDIENGVKDGENGRASGVAFEK